MKNIKNLPIDFIDEEIFDYFINEKLEITKIISSVNFDLYHCKYDHIVIVCRLMEQKSKNRVFLYLFNENLEFKDRFTELAFDNPFISFNDYTKVEKDIDQQIKELTGLKEQLYLLSYNDADPPFSPYSFFEATYSIGSHSSDYLVIATIETSTNSLVDYKFLKK